MAQVDDVVAKLRLDLQDFSKGLKSAQEQMTQSTKAMSGSVDGLTKSFGTLQGSFSAISAGIKGIFASAVVAGAVNLVKSVANVGDELNKLSIQTGASVEDLSALRVAAQLNDTSIGDVARSITFLGRSMTEARQGPGAAREAFAALNLTLDDLAELSKNPIAAMERVVTGIEGMGNTADRATVKMVTMGRGASEQSAFFQDFAQRGMAGLREESDRLNQTWTTESARAADAFNDAMDRVKMSATGLAKHLVTNVMPYITRFLDDVRRILGAGDAAEKAGASLNQLITQKAEINRQLALSEAQLLKLPEHMRAAEEEKINTLKKQRLDIETKEFTLNTALRKLTEEPSTPKADTGKSVLAPSIEKTTTALTEQLKAIDKNSKTMAAYTGQGSKGYDALTAKIGVYKNAIEEANKLTGEQAVAPDDPRMKVLTTTHDALVKQLEKREKAERDANKATSEAESKAKATAEALKKLGEEERKVALQSAIMGPTFDAAGAQLGQLQREIEFAIEHGTIPAGVAVDKLRDKIRQLTSQQELANLGKQFSAITLSEAVFHDTLAAGEARIQAYTTTIGNLATRIGDSALPQMKALKDAQDEESRRLRPTVEGAKVGELYKAYAMGLQALNDEQARFSDEGARAAKMLELHQTLYQGLIRLGYGAADFTKLIADNLAQIKLPDLTKVLAPSARGEELFKGMGLETFDPLADRVRRLKQELDRVHADETIDLHSQQVQNLTASYERLSQVMRLGDIGHEAFTEFTKGFDDMLTNIIEGTDSIGKSFDKLAQSLILGFTRRVLAEMFRPLDEAMVKLMRQLVQLGIENIPGLLGLGYAGGKTVTVDTPGLVPSYPTAQHGGLFTKPTLAMIAEAGSPEAVIPTHKLDAWMAGMMAGMEPGGSAVQVTIINNAKNTQVTQQQRTDPQGNRSLDVIVDEMVAQQLSRTGSASSRALRSVYGTSQVLTGR